jgi:hypothetical protein
MKSGNNPCSIWNRAPRFHRGATGNIAFRSGHTLHWDAVNERFPTTQTPTLWGVKYRSPWQLPYASGHNPVNRILLFMRNLRDRI